MLSPGPARSPGSPSPEPAPRPATHDRTPRSRTWPCQIAALAGAWQEALGGPGAPRAVRPRAGRGRIFGKKALMANLVFILKLLTMIFLG